MKNVFAGNEVIGEFSMDIEFDDNLGMKIQTHVDFSEVPEALKALGFDGDGGLEKAKIVTHEVIVGKHFEGGLGIDRSDAEKSAKSGNANNPKELKEAQEGKKARPAGPVQQEVLTQTPKQVQEVQEFAQPNWEQDKQKETR